MVHVEESNVIIRFVRFRVGDGTPNNDALGITAWAGEWVSRVIVDHVSLSWATDENFDVRGNGGLRDITLQNSLLGESGYGLLVNGNNSRVSILRNFFAHCSERNVQCNDKDDDVPASKMHFEQINNILYGWEISATQATFGNRFALVNNEYRMSSEVSVWYPKYVTLTDYGQTVP